MTRFNKINVVSKSVSNYGIILQLLFVSHFLCGKGLSENTTLGKSVKNPNSTMVSYPSTAGHCVMYGICGEFGDFGEQTCRVNHPPLELDDDSLISLREYCPELVDKNGPNLCCDSDQVEKLTQNLALPRALIGRCPSCFHNFRRSFCEFTCSPRQSEFLNVTEVAPTSEEALEIEPDLPREIVRRVDFLISKKYIQETFESCKNVTLSSTNGPALDILCGKWGSLECTAERWFEYLGSTTNNYSPFDIIYHPVEIGAKGQKLKDKLQPLNIPTYSCAEMPPGGRRRCTCADCPASCPAQRPLARRRV